MEKLGRPPVFTAGNLKNGLRAGNTISIGRTVEIIECIQQQIILRKPAGGAFRVRTKRIQDGFLLRCRNELKYSSTSIGVYTILTGTAHKRGAEEIAFWIQGDATQWLPAVAV